MRKRKDQQDRDIVTALGCNAIEEDYFARELRENLTAQGFLDLDDDIPGRSQDEKDSYRRVKTIERMEADRCPRFTEEYPGREDNMASRKPMAPMKDEVTISGSFKIRRIWSGKKKRWYIVMESSKGSTILIGGTNNVPWAVTDVEVLQREEKKAEVTRM